MAVEFRETCVLVCDLCGFEQQSMRTNDAWPSRFFGALHDMGWITEGAKAGGKDLCPQCAKQRQDTGGGDG